MNNPNDTLGVDVPQEPEVPFTMSQFANRADYDEAARKWREGREVFVPAGVKEGQPPQPDGRLQELANSIKHVGLAVFDGPECPQMVRDAIEWFAAELSVSQLPAGVKVDYCAQDGTCSCAKFAADPTNCERRMERAAGVTLLDDQVKGAP